MGGEGLGRGMETDTADSLQMPVAITEWHAPSAMPRTLTLLQVGDVLGGQGDADAVDGHLMGLLHADLGGLGNVSHSAMRKREVRRGDITSSSLETPATASTGPWSRGQLELLTCMWLEVFPESDVACRPVTEG